MRKNLSLILAALSLILIPYGALAQTILYPGTFDAFHRVHFEELRQGIELTHAKEAIVLPIFNGQYNDTINTDLGITKSRPAVFDRSTRLSIIERSISDLPVSAKVSLEIEQLPMNPLPQILKAAERHAGQVYLLIGTDILSHWKKLPEFQKLLKKVELVVGLDSTDPKGNEELQQEFKSEKRMRFVSLSVPSVRSADINMKFLAGDFDLKNLLRENALTALPGFDEKFLAQIDSYNQKILEYTALEFEAEYGTKAIAPRAAGRAKTFQFWLDFADWYRKGFPQLYKTKNFDSFYDLKDPAQTQQQLSANKRARFFQSTYQATQIAHLKFLIETGRGLPEVRIDKEGTRDSKPVSLSAKVNGEWIQIAKLSTIEAGTPLYHWNDAEQASGWLKVGHGSESEVLWRMANRPANAMGGGFYLSKNAANSSDFGSQGVKFLAEETVLIADLTTIEPFEKMKNPELDFVSMVALLKRAGISAIQLPKIGHLKYGRDSWISAIDSRLLAKAQKIPLSEVVEAYLAADSETKEIIMKGAPLEWMSLYESQGKSLKPIISYWKNWFKVDPYTAAEELRARLSNYLAEPFDLAETKDSPFMRYVREEHADLITNLLEKTERLSSFQRREMVRPGAGVLRCTAVY